MRHCRYSSLRLFLPVIALALCINAIAQEDEEAVRARNYLEEEHALSLEFATPHTPWAKPYAQGATRVVFFAPWYQGGMECREIIELMQRFDLDASAVYQMKGGPLIGDSNPGWYGGDAESGSKRALSLLDAAPAVVFLNQRMPADLPEAVRSKVIECVQRGAGLVVIGGESIALEGIQPAPRDLAAPDGTYYTLGAGRIAHLHARESLEFGIGWEAAFDYQMEAQGRALMWAARKLPEPHLTIQAPPIISRGDLPAASVSLSWTGALDGELDLRLRRADGAAQLLPVGDRRPDGATIPLPVVRAGDYHLDATMRANDMVVTWATAAFAVEDAVDVDVMLARDWAEVGERVDATIEVLGSGTTDIHILARAITMDGRILIEKPLRLNGATASFTFEMESWMPALMRIEAVAVDSRGEAAGANALVIRTNRNRDQFNFVMWNCAGGDLAPYSVQSLAAHGVTSILQGGNAPPYFAESQVAFVPYAASFRASSHTTTAMLDPDTGVLKNGCVHDDAAMQKVVQDAIDAYRRSREVGVLAYSLGDENAVRASCFSPHCLRAYREYLQRTYGAIAALNAEWGTTYGTFDEIELLDDGPLPAPDAPSWFQEYFAEWDLQHRTDNEGAKDAALDRQVAFGTINEELRALQAGNFARWYDRQAFQNWSYVQWCKRYQTAFGELDPQAWTGFEGTDSFSIRKFTTRSRQGGDLDAFVRELDYFGPYKGPANEVVRSIAPKGFPMGNWIGYEPEADVLLQLYWDQICDRMNTVQWWRWDNLSGYHGYLLPSLAPFPAVKELLDDTQVVRDGLGTLLMQSDLQTDRIAMLYSLPSTYIQHFDGNPSYGDYDRDHDLWHTHLHNAGLQFEYVTDRMLRLGEFDASKYSVLILPLAFAMSVEEAAVIREFVETGGTVIADVRPAIYDGHCKPLAKGLLDDVFGIGRTGNREARGIDRMRVNGELDGHALTMEWGNWQGKNVYPQMRVDPNVELTTGKALGAAYHIHYWTGLESPMVVVNSYGKGKGVLLNFAIFDAPAGGLIRDLLKVSGVEPQVVVRDANGALVKDVEITRWRSGGDDLLALLGEQEGDVRVTLPGQRFVYDMKARTKMGATAEFITSLRPHRASFFALLAHDTQAPELRVKRAVGRGETLGVTARVPGAESVHPLVIHGFDPAGVSVELSATTIMAGEKGTEIVVPIAHNGPAGVWQLQVRDTLTGNETTATFDVRE